MSTTTTIRPDSTQSINATTVTGAASANAATSDNSDASFIVANAVGNFAVLTTNNTVSLLANERVERVFIKVRNRTATIGKYAEYLISYLTDAAESARSVVWANDTGIGTDTLYGVVEAPEGGRWLQSHIDGLRIRIGGVTHNDSAYAYPNIYELYADIQVDTQPFVTSLNWTNTDATRPRINWTFNDDDGDPQSAEQVRVFTAAQYGAVGFDPATSAAFWDSGTQASTTPYRDIGKDLVPGTTYRAYVRAARDFMGLENWYSSYVASPDLVVAADVPDTPTLTASADAANNRVSLTLQQRVNTLDANTGNVETSSAGWANQANSTLGTTTTAGEFFKGARALTQTATAAGVMTVRTASRYAVTTGVTYTASAYNRTRVTSRTTRVSIVWYTASTGGSPISTSSGTASANSTTYAQRTVTATAPATAAWAEVWLEVTAAAAISEVHLWDAISLAPGSSTFWGGAGWLPTATNLIEYSDDGGTTWSTLFSAADPPDSSQALVLYDYSAPRGTTRTYRASTQAVTTTASTVSSATSSTTTGLVPLPTTGGYWWLKNLYDPTMNLSVFQTDEMDFTMEEQAGVYRPLGRRGAVVVSHALGGWDSSLSLLTRGAAEYAALERLVETRGPLLLQAPDGMQWHIRIVARSFHQMASPAGNILRGFTLGYNEVDAPVLTGS